MGERTASASVKVLITGSYAVGKTSLVRTLSEVNVLTTRREVAAGTPDDDPTMVAMDFGRKTIEGGLQIQLFGTTGLPVFDTVTEILGEGLVGAIVLVDDSRPDSIEEASTLIEQLTADRDTVFVVAVNKVPEGRESTCAKRARHVMRLPDRIRVTAGDVRDPEDAKAMLLQLLEARRDAAAAMADAERA